MEQQIEYEANNDAEAIRVARDRLGRDAVILSSRPVKKGGVFGLFRREALWVTAGILVPDQEDFQRESRDRMVAFQHLLEVRRAVGAPQAGGEPATAAPAAVSAFSPAATQAVAVRAYEGTATAKPEPETEPAKETEHLAKDVDEIKGILSRVLSRLDGGEEALPAQQSAGAADVADENVRRLLDADVDRRIAVEIAEEYRTDAGEATFADWLAARIPTMGSDPSCALGGKRVLFAGPTGVGKTTTIAKLAAGQSLWENRKVVLMTADTYRIAAVEQLRTYAKILGIPIEIAADPNDVRNAMKKHRDADLILLDTAGRSHYDGGRIDELQELHDAFEPNAVHLVLAANVKYRDMLGIIERMGVVPLSALLFTKLDETASYGTILNVMRDFALPTSFFTIGQNVPNDIEIARGDRFVDFLLNDGMGRGR